MAAAQDVLNAQVVACLKRHIQTGSRLTVGYSGGLDSTVLLHVLAGLRLNVDVIPRFSLSAVHVHHGLSPQADLWARHCAQTCQALGVPLVMRRVDVQPSGEGLEAAARAARYRVYAELDTDFLVLAHHRDDQAETVLLQLLRGAGMRGLAAMPEARLLTGTRVLLRPLLAVKRADISVWAEAHGVLWMEDASNTDTRLTRNALRHAVLPGLTARFPDTPSVLAQAAAQFAEAAFLLDELADLDARAATTEDGLAISALCALPEPRARNLLRRFLVRAGVDIHHAALCEALRQLLQARQDAQVRVDIGDVSLRRYRQSAVLVAVPKSAAMAEPRTIVWRGEDCLELDGDGRLNFRAVIGAGVRLSAGTVTIRRRVGGERIRLAPERPRRTLKNLLREAGIAVWQRQTLPLVYADDALVWAAHLGADCDFLARPGEPGWIIEWRAEQNMAA